MFAASLSVSDSGRAPDPETYRYFASRDGGLSWDGGLNGLYWGERTGREHTTPTEVQWSEVSIDTPMGTYRIEGPNITLTKSGGHPEIVYSVVHWNTSSNRWYQAERTRHLKDRVLATKPTAIAYDPNSGNLIAGLGIQGVAVGAPDGQWTPVAVGKYSPVSYSRELKVKELLRQ